MRTKEELIKYLKEQSLWSRYTEIRDRFDTYEKCLAAVKQNGYDLKFVDASELGEGYYSVCLAAVKRTGDALRFVDASALTAKRYYSVCLAAVKQNGLALQFVSALAFGELYYDVCLAAVKKNGYALQYAKASALGERYYDVCVAAIRQNSCALEYVDAIIYHRYALLRRALRCRLLRYGIVGRIYAAICRRFYLY